MASVFLWLEISTKRLSCPHQLPCHALVPEVVQSLCRFVSLAGDLLSNLPLLEDIKVRCMWWPCTWRPLLTALAPHTHDRMWCDVPAAAAL